MGSEMCIRDRALSELPEGTLSDTRLDHILSLLNKRGAKETRHIERTPVPGAVVKSAQSSLTLTIRRAGESEHFANWLAENIDRLIQDSYQMFQKEDPDR